MTSQSKTTSSPNDTKKCLAYLLILLSISFVIFVSSFYRMSIFPLPVHLVEPQIARVTESLITTGKTQIEENRVPSLQGTNITEGEIQRNLARCAKLSISFNKDCGKVHPNSIRFWRSTVKFGFTHKQDGININLATRCCAFNHSELINPSPSDDMFPWELDYLSQGPLLNMDDTAWASKSAVELVEKPAGKKYYIGDEVRFLIRIRNGRGEARKKGGDSVRLWLASDDLGASVTANVEDNGDGTYAVKSKLPWAGSITVKATIAHTRELFRSILYIQRLFTTSHWFFGIFKNTNASESTPCSPLPFLPGFNRGEVCNFTKENGEYTWYCGKPVKKQLSCSDMVGTIKNDWPSLYPLTEADANLIKLTESKRPFLIPTSIVLVVNKKHKSTVATLPTPSVACHKRDLTTTFKEPMSTGYFYNKKWRPFGCVLPNVTRDFAVNCLKNTTLILIGDSNTRAQFDHLTALVKCVDKIRRTKVRWHAPLRCEIDNLGLSIQCYPHKMPFYGSRGELMTQKMMTSTIAKLDSIPPKGRYIIHLHNFLHMMPFHLSIARTRMLRNRDAIARLLKRNPTTYVIIQSPHASLDRSRFNKHKMNIYLFHITKSIMSGLGNRVMFLNTFDLTIASQNADGHPKNSNEFMNIYLGHMCGR